MEMEMEMNGKKGLREWIRALAALGVAGCASVAAGCSGIPAEVGSHAPETLSAEERSGRMRACSGVLAGELEGSLRAAAADSSVAEAGPVVFTRRFPRPDGGVELEWIVRRDGSRWRGLVLGSAVEAEALSPSSACSGFVPRSAWRPAPGESAGSSEGAALAVAFAKARPALVRALASPGEKSAFVRQGGSALPRGEALLLERFGGCLWRLRLGSDGKLDPVSVSPGSCLAADPPPGGRDPR